MSDIVLPEPTETRVAATADSPIRSRRRAGLWAAWLTELSRPRSDTETRARLACQLQG